MPFVLSFLFVIELFILLSVWNGGCCYPTGVSWVLGEVRVLRSLYKWRVNALQQPWCPLGADKVVWERFVLNLFGCLQQLWLQSNSWRELEDNKGNFSLLMIWGGWWKIVLSVPQIWGVLKKVGDRNMTVVLSHAVSNKPQLRFCL